MFKRNYFFFHHCLLFCRYVSSKNSILRKPNWEGAQATVRGGMAPLPPRSYGTDLATLQFLKNQNCDFVQARSTSTFILFANFDR